MIATIKPTKIRLYINSNHETMAQIKAALGCQYIINGSLFEGNKACCQVKADGVVYANDGYKYYGFAWNDVSDFKLMRVPDSTKKNYIACVDVLRDGKTGSMNYNSQIAGARQRTAIGTKADGSIVLFCTQVGITPERVKEEMEKAGCVDALMLDGGKSSQCDFNGKALTVSAANSRALHNYLCFWTEDGGKNMPVYGKGSQGEGVRVLQQRLKDCGIKVDGEEIKVDGDFGNKTAAAVKIFQKNMNLTDDGIAGQLTQSALEIAASWQSSKLPLVLAAGRHLGEAEPKQDDKIIDAFNDLTGSSFGHTDPWCQMLVVVVQAEAGLDPYVTASCTVAFNYFATEGRVVFEPVLGYLVYLDWDRSGDCDHVGIVAEEKDGYIYVIEGNASGTGPDAVRIKRYKSDDSRIRGYANPYAPKKEYYLVKLEKAAALKLAAEYGGEIVKYEG